MSGMLQCPNLRLMLSPLIRRLGLLGGSVSPVARLAAAMGNSHHENRVPDHFEAVLSRKVRLYAFQDDRMIIHQ